MTLPEKRVRPAGNGTDSADQAGGRSVISMTDAAPSRLPACRECGHRLRAEESVRMGIGPVCRRRFALAVVA